MSEVLSGCAVRAEIQREKFSAAYLIDFLESDCLGLRCIVTKYGMDDSDISWEVIQHYQAKPHKRRIGRGDTPREAIIDAIKTTEAELSRIAMGK